MRRTYLGAHRIRHTFLGADYRAWAVVLAAGLLFPVLGWLAIALLALAASS